MKFYFHIVKGQQMWRIEQFTRRGGSQICVRYCHNWKEAVVVLGAWGVW